jgi:hypothetical protein
MMLPQQVFVGSLLLPVLSSPSVLWWSVFSWLSGHNLQRGCGV